MISSVIVLYSSIYIAPLNSSGPAEALLVRLAPKKRHVLRSDKEVGTWYDKNEARADGVISGVMLFIGW